MGGFTPERHISLESGRNVYSKLVASCKYNALPLFLSGSGESYRIFTLPAALLLKDNADDIHDALLHPIRFSKSEALLTSIRKGAACVAKNYAKDAIFTPEKLPFIALKARVDFLIFIVLYGRPGEDGTLQRILKEYDIPYNGSGIATTALTIDKYATNQFLSQKGFHMAQQLVITKEDWSYHQDRSVYAIEDTFTYPIFAKPVDNGCTVGVIRITDRAMLIAYAAASFRNKPLISVGLIEKLGLQAADSVPQQERFLLETLI